MLPSWDANCERRTKEVLYRCLEELGSTKAALYLAADTGNFELATHYGFGRRDKLLAVITPDEPLWDWIRRHRTLPAFLNEVHPNTPLATLLEEAGTARLMTIPLSVRDRLVGFVDLRDKARRQPFTPEDQAIAKSIGAALERLLGELGLYGPPIPAPPPEVGPEREARPTQALVRRLHESTLAEVTALLRQCVRLPGVSAAALTVASDTAVQALVLRTVPLDRRERDALAAHQLQELQAAGLHAPPPAAWSWREEESGGGEKHGGEIATSLVFSGPPVWVVASLLTSGGNVAETVHTVLARHARVAEALEGYRRATRNFARILLEPGEQGLPALRQHSQAVSELAQRLAVELGLPSQEEELITLAAYLHDVGMRELEYARLYRAPHVGEVEKRLFRRHPTVGARIVESAEFPGDLAAAIRHHHERWDGEGYPGRLRGPAIPLASRIIHLAEVYDVLTSAGSYRRAVGRDAALATIRDEAGKQFDPELVPVLARVVTP